jgi:hypothetical protein
MIIFLDDAQRLHGDHYEWLMDISNELEAVGFKVTVLLVGQPELEYQRSIFVKANKMQLVGRFMIHFTEFHGIRNQAEMAICLRRYDSADAAQYPPDSGYSYARYFFTEAFDEGWRLEYLSRQLWQAFEIATESSRSTRRLEVPMQHFTSVVEHFLISYQGANPEQHISQGTLNELTINSGIRDREALFTLAEANAPSLE